MHAHLDALGTLLDAEHEAFDAHLRRRAPRVPQLPLPEPCRVAAGALVHSSGRPRRDGALDRRRRATGT